MIAVRICKTSLVAATTLFLFLVVLNNLLDYGSNYKFVEGVLSMETTFAENKLMWRAVSSPTVHTAFYIAIILWETVSCVLCAWGTLNLVGALKTDGVLFNRAKKVAICGLTLSLLLWYVAFITVGSDWFLMWQSELWDGGDPAFRMFAIMGICLIFLNMKDDDLYRQRR